MKMQHEVFTYWNVRTQQVKPIRWGEELQEQQGTGEGGSGGSAERGFPIFLARPGQGARDRHVMSSAWGSRCLLWLSGQPKGSLGARSHAVSHHLSRLMTVALWPCVHPSPWVSSLNPLVGIRRVFFLYIIPISSLLRALMDRRIPIH